MKKILFLLSLILTVSLFSAEKKKDIEFKLSRQEGMPGIRVKVPKEAIQLPVPLVSLTWNPKVLDKNKKAQLTGNILDLWKYDQLLGWWIGKPDCSLTYLYEVRCKAPTDVKNGVVADYDAFLKEAKMPESDQDFIDLMKFFSGSVPLEPAFIPVSKGKDKSVRRYNCAPNNMTHNKQNLTMCFYLISPLKPDVNVRHYILVYCIPIVADQKQSDKFLAEADKAAASVGLGAVKVKSAKEENEERAAAQDPFPVYTRQLAATERVVGLIKDWIRDDWDKKYQVFAGVKNKKALKDIKEEVMQARIACERYLPELQQYCSPAILTFFGTASDYQQYVGEKDKKLTAVFMPPNGDIAFSPPVEKKDVKTDKKAPTVNVNEGNINIQVARQYMAFGCGNRTPQAWVDEGFRIFFKNAKKTRGKNVRIYPEKELLAYWTEFLPKDEELKSMIASFHTMKDDDFLEKQMDAHLASAGAMVYFMMKSPALYSDKKYNQIPLKYFEALRKDVANPSLEAFKGVDMTAFCTDLTEFLKSRSALEKAENYIPPSKSGETDKAVEKEDEKSLPNDAKKENVVEKEQTEKKAPVKKSAKK